MSNVLLMLTTLCDCGCVAVVLCLTHKHLAVSFLSW